MTREESIDILTLRKDCHDELSEALAMAIEALSQPIVAKHFDIQSGYIYCSPQIAENVKVVVRCKDCRYYKCGVDLCESLGDDGFCSYGKRKGGDADDQL